MKTSRTYIFVSFLLPVLVLCSCATVLNTQAERAALVEESQSALKSMQARDTDVVNAFDAIAHDLGGYHGFLSDRDIARSR